VINKYLEILDKVRKDEISISDYLYKEGKDHEGYSCDVNCDKRYRLLIAIQYDRKKSDEKILKRLMDAEIEMHNNSPFQGLHTSMRLNAFLLSEFNKPEYSLLFVKAKNSNFDTHCGFDSEYLLSAGIKETYQYLKENSNEETEAFYELLGKTSKDCFYSDKDVNEWTSRMKEWFPSEYNPSLVEEIQLAVDLGEDEILLSRIEEWKKTVSEWNASTLNELAYYSGLVQDNNGKIWANEELLKLKTTDWDKASQLQINSSLYLELDNNADAWRSIQKAHELLQSNLEWKQYGLGRFIMENTLDVILAIKDPKSDITEVAYRFFKEQIKGMENLHHDLMRKTIKVAEQLKNKELEEEFKKKLKMAEDELNRMLNE